MSFDELQAAVAGHGRGPLMVNAGPGTGKTACLTARFAALVKVGLAAPTDILAVTFTREAAGVMRERVQRLLEEDVDGLRISTIHSLAYGILRLGGRKRLKVAPPEEAYEHFQRAMLEVGLSQDRWNAEALFRLVNGLKEHLIGPEQCQATPGSVFQENVQRVYRRYQQVLAEEGVLDFGDLIIGAVEKLYGDPTLMAYLRSLTPFVMVDEFQDTSRAQYELVRLLVGDDRSLVVVGSPAQTIHEWRGARMGELQAAFRRDFPDASEQTLRVNYRSTPNIVAAASAVGQGYPDAAQETHRDAGEPILAWRPANQYEEAGRAVMAVRRWLDEGFTPDEIAILYRTHRQADVLESQLSASGVPYVLTGVERLYNRPEAQHLLAYLSLALDPERDGALELIVNAPPRGLGPNTVARIKGSDPVLSLQALRAAAHGRDGLPPRAVEAAARLVGQIDLLARKAQELPPGKMIEFVVETTGYREWTESLLDGYRRTRALAQMARDADGFDDLSAFLAYAGQRAGDATGEGVHLSTIHAAKGQEWKAVIVVGVVEGLLPHARALKQSREPEEERRLLYVAMTRAKDRLILSAPRSQVDGNDLRELAPSRYLRLVPAGLIKVQ